MQEARIRLWRTEVAATSSPENPAAYARRTIQNTVRDLYRRQWRRVREVTIDEIPPRFESGPDDIEVPNELEDECRRAAHGVLAAGIWAGAAVLNELTFRLHLDVPIPLDAPAPIASTDDQECSWAALWLAGRADCFPDAEHDDNTAMRKRRSRALESVAARLRQAVEVALAGAGPR
jgi:hypothetical protein